MCPSTSGDGGHLRGTTVGPTSRLRLPGHYCPLRQGRRPRYGGATRGLTLELSTQFGKTTARRGHGIAV